MTFAPTVNSSHPVTLTLTHEADVRLCWQNPSLNERALSSPHNARFIRDGSLLTVNAVHNTFILLFYSSIQMLPSVPREFHSCSCSCFMFGDRFGSDGYVKSHC